MMNSEIESRFRDIVRLKRIARKHYRAGNREQALSILKDALDIALETGDEVQEGIIKGQIAAIEKLKHFDDGLDLDPARKEIRGRRWNRVRKLRRESEERTKCRVYLAADVRTFRRFARELPIKDDIVLELGCSTGKTTRILSQSAGRAFGVEKNRIADKARDDLREFGNVTIIHEDAQNIYQIFEKVGPVSMIFIDIGGNATPGRTIWLARRYMRMFSPKVLVIRNNELSEFVSSLEYYEKWDTGRWS